MDGVTDLRSVKVTTAYRKQSSPPPKKKNDQQNRSTCSIETATFYLSFTFPCFSVGGREI